MALVKVLKAHQGPQGFVHAGATIEIDIHRQRALARNGIVPAPDGAPAAEPAPRTPGAITSGTFRPRRETLTLPKDADQAAPIAAVADEPAPRGAVKGNKSEK
jgi:hypothetical protein